MADFADSLTSQIDASTDGLRRLMGLKIAQLPGRAITPDDGFGDDPRIAAKVASIAYGPDSDVEMDALYRLASVSPFSKGDGLIATLLGDRGEGIQILLGRVAKGSYDSLEFIHKRKAFSSHALPVQRNQTDYIDDTEIKTTVRVPTNTNTTVALLAYAQVRAATAATQVDMRIRIGGTDVQADPSIANFTGAVGPPSSCGKGDTNVQPVFTVHVRTFYIKSDTDDYSDQNVNLRWSCFGGSGNSDIRAGMLAGFKVVW